MSMPAVSVQSAVPAGAGNAGTPHVSAAAPLDATGCSVPTPAEVTNAGLIRQSAPAGPQPGPLEVGSGGSLSAATYGGGFSPDVRVIDVPSPPRASGGDDSPAAS